MQGNFRSCFIVDVNITKNSICLTDSGKQQYFIDTTDPAAVTEFSTWFKTVFTKGIAQTLTVFRYELRYESECESKIYIKKFILNNQ